MEDAAAATRKWLREATDSEGVRPDGIGTKSGGSVTFAELAAFAAPLAKEPKLNARYRALLELAAAVASALPGTSPRVDELSERRDACLRVILSETHSAAARRRGDGSGPAAPRRSSPASGTRTDPGAPARAAARRRGAVRRGSRHRGGSRIR